MVTTRCKTADVLALLLVCALAAPAGAQEKESPQVVLQRAQGALAKGDFESAYRDFSTYADKYSASPAHSAALLGAAKSALYSGKYEAAVKYADAFIALPISSTQAVAFLYKGNALAARYQLKEALAAYSEGFKRTGDPNHRQAFVTVTGRLAGLLEPRQAQKIFTFELPPDMAAPAWRQIGSGLEATGQKYLAMSYYTGIAERFAGLDVAESAESRRVALEAELAKSIRIGVVTPLSGNLAKYGEEMNQGIAMAAKEFREKSGRDVELLVEDSKGLPVPATRACQSILDREPAAVIGPLTSASAIGCAAAAAARDIPIVVPAASETELASLGDHVYCLSPSLETYGKNLGWFTVETLGLCSHLVVAPDDDFGHRLAAAYRQAVEEAGGTIWREAFYAPGVPDFGPYLKAFRASFLDTLSDSSWRRGPDGKKRDLEDIPVYPEAIFLPGYAEDLVQLIPQVRFYKIEGRLVGTDSFADEDVMMRVGGNLEEAVFASVEPLASGSLEWEQFSSKFARSYGRAPGRLAALGYDAFRLIAGAMTPSLVTPAVVGDYLGGIDSFDGAMGKVEFDFSGENTRVPLYYIRGSKVFAARR